MKKNIVLLLVIGILPLLSLLTPGLPVTHDGQDHVARVANFYQSLSEGNLVPRWASNLNWGFGHPILMFLYPLPSYVASIFHGIGFSLVDSVKLVFGFSFVGSMVAMYLFAREEWGEEGGIVAGILYGFAPYHFVNLYVRGAFGEHAAFVFLPCILLGMNKIAKVKSSMGWGIFLAISIAGLFLAHNAVSIMIAPVALVYGIYLWWFESKKNPIYFLKILSYVVYSVGLSAFFLIPAYFEGKYTLRDIVTQNEIGSRMVPLQSFFYSPWNYGGGIEFTKELGLPVLITVTICIIFAFQLKINQKKVYILGILGLLCLYIFLMTSPSMFIWNTFTLLQKFQFPWRLMVITSLLGALCGSVVIAHLSKKYKQAITIGIVILSVFSTVNMWHPKAYKTFDESFFKGIYNGTTDTGESSPIWSIRFMEYRPEKPMEISEGDSIITSTKRTTTTRSYHVSSLTKTRLVENTLYFPGWHVYVDASEVPVEFQDPQWRGRMTFWVEPGEHTIEVIFKETKLRYVSNLVSMISLVGLIPLVFFAYKYKLKKV